MGFSDIIKSSVLERFQSSNISLIIVAITLGAAVGLGLFIYFVYRFNTKNSFYNKNFNKSLATLPVITAAIMLAMGSNLTIGLGMVGALSIVRFRSAVKDPADLTYLFWSISVGIVAGANMVELAVVLSIIMVIVLYGLDLLPTLRSPGIIVISADNVSAEKEMLAAIKAAGSCKLRSRSISKRGVEWVLEIRVRNENELVEKLMEIEHISSVNVMSHDGELRF